MFMVTGGSIRVGQRLENYLGVADKQVVWLFTVKFNDNCTNF